MDETHLLMAYVDGELDAATAAEVERRIAADPRARAQVALYRDTTSWLKSACGEAHYPQGAMRVAVSRRKIGLALAASIGIGVLGFGVGRVLPGSDATDLLTEVAEYHAVFSRETAHLVELPASRAAEAVAWLGARLGRGFAVPDLGPASLKFAGARMLVIDRRPVADLLYTRDRGPPVALCIARAAAGAMPIRLARRDGLQLATWRDGGYAYVVVGDLEPGAARDIAERAAVQLRG